MRTLACRAYWTRPRGSPGGGAPELPAARAAGDRRAAARGGLGSTDAPPDGQPLRHPLDRRVARRPRTPRPSREPVSGAAAGWSWPGVTSATRRSVQAAAAFCAAAGWPLLADPLSGARRGAAAIAHYDVLLRDGAFAAGTTPDLVLRVGDLPTSKPLRAWLAGLRDVAPDRARPRGRLAGPRRRALPTAFALEPAAALLAAGRQRRPAADADWLAGWRSADERPPRRSSACSARAV